MQSDGQLVDVHKVNRRAAAFETVCNSLRHLGDMVRICRFSSYAHGQHVVVPRAAKARPLCLA